MKFKQLTDLPNYDEMIRNKEYFENAKNKTYSIVMMSPLDYLMKCQKGFSKYYETIVELLDSRLSNLERLENLQLEEHYMIMLDYSNGFSQEGITRAMLAFKKEIKEIPVMIVHRKEKNKRAWF